MKRLLLLLIFTSCLFADDPVMRPPNEEITPKAQPYVKNGVAEPYLTADFIYWKAREDSLQYLLTGTGTETQPLSGTGKVHEADANGHLGFKVGLGLNIAHDGWDIYVQYTWLQANEDDRFRGDFGNELIGDRFLVGGVTNAHADWDFHFNVIDLEWGRQLYISPFLRLRPFVGLKGFWSDQDFQVKTEGFRDLGWTILAHDDFHFDEDSWGLGIRFGLQTIWSFTRNFGVFGNLALATQWCRFYEKVRQNGFLVASNQTVSLMKVNHHQYQMVPVLELALGMRWEMWFHQDSYHVAIQWGWEEQMWWNYARLLQMQHAAPSGDNLNFQGLTVRFRFDF